MSFDGYAKNDLDADIERRIVEHCERFHIRPIDAVKLFPVLARRQWLKLFIARNELFKRSIPVPGDIAELGVFRGGGLLTWANLLEVYAIGNRTKVVYGFDNFKGFKTLVPEDGAEVPALQKHIGGFSPSEFYDELKSAISIFDADRFIPQKARIKIIEGDIEESVPDFLERNPGVRFSFVHFDCDLYEPTRIALQAIWNRVSRGGIVVFDEYAIREWPGETAAVDEFFEKLEGYHLQTFPWTNAPAAFIVKEK